MPEKLRVFYIDLFRRVNSNPYWLKAFKKVAHTAAFDIRGPREAILPQILKFRPHHIHLGGSVKNGAVAPEVLLRAKDELHCTISAFYGDARYSTYHLELAEIADFLYINNRTHIRQNQALGHKNFVYLPCPTDPEIFRPLPAEKRYDLLFVGNNYSPERREILEELHGAFHLTVVGRGWGASPFNALPEAYGEQFAVTVAQAKICLGLIDDAWAGLEGSFSNRVVNTLACGAFLLQRYTPGLETLFKNHVHLVWYHHRDELQDLARRYLRLPYERALIGSRGRQVVLAHFTFDRAVRRILGDSWPREHGISHGFPQ